MPEEYLGGYITVAGSLAAGGSVGVGLLFAGLIEPNRVGGYTYDS